MRGRGGTGAPRRRGRSETPPAHARPRGLVTAILLVSALPALGRADPASVAAAVPHAVGAPVEDGCPILPAEDPLNQEIANAPASPNSAEYVASIGLSAHLHPDFGTNPRYGIPYTVVAAEQPKVPIKLTKFRALSSICAATRCGPKAGPPPTRPACPSFRCWSAIRKSAPGRSATRCA